MKHLLVWALYVDNARHLACSFAMRANTVDCFSASSLTPHGFPRRLNSTQVLSPLHSSWSDLTRSLQAFPGLYQMTKSRLSSAPHADHFNWIGKWESCDYGLNVTLNCSSFTQYILVICCLEVVSFLFSELFNDCTCLLSSLTIRVRSLCQTIVRVRGYYEVSHLKPTRLSDRTKSFTLAIVTTLGKNLTHIPQRR